MNAGVATIVNAHGAMAELPPDSVWKMDDTFTVADLAAALEALWRNPERRTVLAQRGSAHIARNHQPRLCATAYADAIEHYYARAATGEHGLLRALLERSGSFSDAEWASLSEAMAQNLPKRPRSHRLFIDISSLMRTDLTVVGEVPEQQALLSLLLAAPPRGWTVEPVYMDETRFRYARRFTSRFLNIPDNWCQDGVAEPALGDAFLDLGNTVLNPVLQGIMRGLRRRGIDAYRMTWQATRSEAGSGEDDWWEALGPFNDALCAALKITEELHTHTAYYTEK